MPQPLLARRSDSVLVIVDIQEKLLPVIAGHEAMLANVRLLIQGASVLGIPVIMAEQYPKGLGHTVPAVRELLPDAAVHEKTTFSCARDGNWRQAFEACGRRQAVICGIETHVCVLQTALDLLSRGFGVFLAADAVGSRASANRDLAVSRMQQAGVIAAPAESLLFEWTERSGNDDFRQVARLVR